MSEPTPHNVPKASEPPTDSGNLLWIAFAAILNVAALLVLFAIFRDTTDTASFLANRNQELNVRIGQVKQQNEELLFEVRRIQKAMGLPTSQPSTTP